MNSKYKNLLKDTMIFALGSFGSKVILFFLVPLYTNYLTADEYGIADLISTFSQLIIPITSLMISSAVIRFGMMKSEKSEDVIVNAFCVIGFSIVTTFMIIFLLGWYAPVKEWRWYLFVQVILSNIAEIEKTYLKVKNKNKIFSIISVFQTLILAITNVLLLTIFNQGVRGYIIANIAGALVGVIIAFFAGNLYNDLSEGSFNMDLLKRMIMYSSPLIFGNISWWVIHSSDKIMIQAMLSASALGIYTVATKIPSLINVIIAIFSQAWGISSIKEIESTKKTDFISSVFNLYSTTVFGAAILLITFIKPFMNIYVGNDFKGSWIYTPLLLAAAAFFSLSVFISSLYSALQKTKNDMWTTILCAVINLIVNYIGISFLGVWGAIIGTVTAYFICAVVRIIDINRFLKINIKKNLYINMLILIFQSIAIAVQWHIVFVSSIGCSLFVLLNFEEIRKALGRAFYKKH